MTFAKPCICFRVFLYTPHIKVRYNLDWKHITHINSSKKVLPVFIAYIQYCNEIPFCVCVNEQLNAKYVHRILQ